MRGRFNWRLNLALTVVSTLIALVLSFGVAEVAVRYRESHRTTPPGSIPFVLYRQERLRTALTRASNYFGWIHIDSEGFRGAEVHLQKQPGELRIMAVGASTTFDVQTTADSDTWPSRLQTLLRQDGHPVEVINAGTPGYTVLDNYVRLEAELYRYHPDVIILYHAHNDLYADLRQAQNPDTGYVGHRPEQVAAESAPIRWLSEHSLLFAKIRTGIALRLFRFGRSNEARRITVPPRQWEAALERGSAEFGQDLSAFLAVARQHKIRVVMPEVVETSGGDTLENDPHERWNWEHSVVGVPVPMVLRGYRLYNARIRSVASCFGALYIPADSDALKGPEWYGQGDPIHFDDAGAARFARHLARALERANVLSSAGVLNAPATTSACSA